MEEDKERQQLLKDTLRGNCTAMTKMRFLRTFVGELHCLPVQTWEDLLGKDIVLYIGSQKIVTGGKLVGVKSHNILEIESLGLVWIHSFSFGDYAILAPTLELDENKTLECTCGAKHTSRPNFHLSYCEVKDNG